MIDLLAGFGAVDEDGKFIFGPQAGQATLSALGLRWENGKLTTTFNGDTVIDLGTQEGKV